MIFAPSRLLVDTFGGIMSISPSSSFLAFAIRFKIHCRDMFSMPIISASFLILNAIISCRSGGRVAQFISADQDTPSSARSWSFGISFLNCLYFSIAFVERSILSATSCVKVVISVDSPSSSRSSRIELSKMAASLARMDGFGVSLVCRFMDISLRRRSASDFGISVTITGTLFKPACFAARYRLCPDSIW